MALRRLVDALGDRMVLIADLCLDEYTDHGHCGIVDAQGDVDNDLTLARYAEVAVAQAQAGADVVAPSGMMDGQVGAIRAGLDSAGFANVGDPGVRSQVRLGAVWPVSGCGGREHRRRG